MQRSWITRMGWASGSAVCLSRRGHGGSKQTRKELERMVLLEHAQERPSQQRQQAQQYRSAPQPSHRHSAAAEAEASSPTTSAAGGGTATRAEVASFLRGVDDRVESARREIFGDLSSSSSSPQGTAFAPLPAQDSGTATSLSGFINECKRLRLDVGLERRQKEREAQRQKLREFWAQHADSAVMCCQMWGRDFGFVAGHGLSDDGLHMSLPALRAALATLQAEKDTSSVLDVMLSLHYITRELVYWEKLVARSRATSSRERRHETHTQATAVGEESETVELPSREALADLRHAVTDIAVDKIFLFFVLSTPPSTGAAATTTTEGEEEDDGEEVSVDGREGKSPPTTLSLAERGTARDALSALEVLSRVRVKDASRSLLTTLQQQAGTTTGEKDDGVVVMDQAFFVTRVFLVLTTEKRRFMNFTCLVQAFALLRIFLPVLWPPYDYGDRTQHGVPAAAHDINKKDNGPITTTTTAQAAASGALIPRRSLAKEREALQRITWGLAVGLKKRDSSFVNPYHFVKITATLARLPAFTLAPYGSSATSVSWPGGEDHGGSGAAHHHEGRREMRSLMDLPMNTLFGGGSPGTGRERRSGTDEHSGSIFATSPPPHGRLAAAEHRAQPALSAADFWRYIVAKAAIFLPSLPLTQRRAAVSGLHKAISEKRGKLLASANATAAAAREGRGQHSTTSSSSSSGGGAGSGWVVEELGDSAEDILLPLVEEMAGLEESFDESLRRAGGGQGRRSRKPTRRPEQQRQRPSNGGAQGSRQDRPPPPGSAFGHPPQKATPQRPPSGFGQIAGR